VRSQLLPWQFDKTAAERVKDRTLFPRKLTAFHSKPGRLPSKD